MVKLLLQSGNVYIDIVDKPMHLEGRSDDDPWFLSFSMCNVFKKDYVDGCVEACSIPLISLNHRGKRRKKAWSSP